MERPTKEQWERLTEEQQEQVTEWGKSRVWKPEMGEDYWYITQMGEVNDTHWGCTRVDIYLRDINEIYRTKEECEFAKERKLVIGQLERLAEESGESSDEYWYIDTDIDDNSEDIGVFWGNHHIPQQKEFATKESAEKAIETVGEKKIKKYYLGV